MSVNPNGEAEVLKVIFRQRAKLKRAIVDLDFSTLAIKGRASQGNIFSRYPIHKILLKSKGASTLAGQQIWYDEDVQKLNDSGHGRLLGEFEGDDKIIVFTAKDQFYTTGYDVGHHFPEDTVRVEKYDSSKIYTVAYWDDTIKKFYLKRFMAEVTDKLLSFVDEENPKSHSLCISDEPRPALEVIYGGVHSTKPSDMIDAVEFIGVKGYKAKGKRISTFEIDKVRFVPQHFAPSPDELPTNEEEQEPVEEATEPTTVNLIVEEPEVESTEKSEPAQEPADVATEEPEPIVQEVVVLDNDGEEVERITEVVKPTSEVELEIIVPADEEESKGPQITQLDLF